MPRRIKLSLTNSSCDHLEDASRTKHAYHTFQEHNGKKQEEDSLLCEEDKGSGDDVESNDSMSTITATCCWSNYLSTIKFYCCLSGADEDSETVTASAAFTSSASSSSSLKQPRNRHRSVRIDSDTPSKHTSSISNMKKLINYHSRMNQTKQSFITSTMHKNALQTASKLLVQISEKNPSRCEFIIIFLELPQIFPL
ncbi:unnamed protein product [Anisakis simplex]|uniref:Wsv025 n=1 Tax=Anisakis simplex TaxID=6269 RepID=A0A0M3JX99_ANISI|nr:unnamed protein product [Anisakis simplex]